MDIFQLFGKCVRIRVAQSERNAGRTGRRRCDRALVSRGDRDGRRFSKASRLRAQVRALSGICAARFPFDVRLPRVYAFETVLVCSAVYGVSRGGVRRIHTDSFAGTCVLPHGRIYRYVGRAGGNFVFVGMFRGGCGNRPKTQKESSSRPKGLTRGARWIIMGFDGCFTPSAQARGRSFSGRIYGKRKSRNCIDQV